jgi:hypothetical protein
VELTFSDVKGFINLEMSLFDAAWFLLYLIKSFITEFMTVNDVLIVCDGNDWFCMIFYYLSPKKEN